MGKSGLSMVVPNDMWSDAGNIMHSYDNIASIVVLFLQLLLFKTKLQTKNALFFTIFHLFKAHEKHSSCLVSLLLVRFCSASSASCDAAAVVVACCSLLRFLFCLFVRVPYDGVLFQALVFVSSLLSKSTLAV